MASYYMQGYTPPEGVNSVSKVKEYQRQLGVKADGIWGPDTDAAYRASLAPKTNTQGFTWGDSGRDGLFNSYYNAIKESLTLPAMPVKTPDKQEVASIWGDILRPSADAAIERRSRAAREDMAELDADAVSRGMGSSSFLSSVKAREMADAQDDISDIEAQYSATLAERIYETLSQYDRMNQSAMQYNAEAASSAAKSALEIASSWYTQYMNQQAAAKKAQEKSGGTSAAKKSGGLSAADYREYVDNLTPAQRNLLFNSGSDYWAARRDELYAGLGDALYSSLKRKYGA